MIFGKPPDHLIKVATLIKDFWKLWVHRHFFCGSVVFFANRIVRAASSGDKVQVPWQALHFVRRGENWHEASILR